jgi:mono/diheme cytochrome c family protein
VMAGLSSKTAFRIGVALPLLVLGLLILPGCSDSYPKDLNYPLRSDPIVVKTPDTPITQIDPPGTQEKWIDSIPDKGGQLLDPTAGVEKQQLAKVNAILSKGNFDLSDEDVRAMGLASKPSKEEVKAALESRRDTLDKRIKAIDQTMAKVRPQLDKVLKNLFGTPANPKVDLGEDDDNKKIADGARLDEKTLAEGSRLYRRHCLHCHGLTGDGHGPTGPWVNPHPRDYRLGKFKFTSSDQPSGSRKARREDLLRTLKQGVEGTSMPSFALLDEETELQPIISYIIHLSLRGQIELGVLADVLGPNADKDAGVDEDAIREKLDNLWKTWVGTEKKHISTGKVPAYASVPEGQLSDAEKTERKKELDASIRRGFDQFTTGSAQCLKCHNDFGRPNDGAYRYDDWGTIVRPANLTAGVYRGGRRPLDLYYRIHSGINGSGMPAYINSPLSSEQVWDVVNFLEALPFPNMLPPEVREQVYVKGKE